MESKNKPAFYVALTKEEIFISQGIKSLLPIMSLESIKTTGEISSVVLEKCVDKAFELSNIIIEKLNDKYHVNSMFENEIEKVIFTFLNLKMEELFTRNGTSELVWGRRVVWYFLREILGVTYASISKRYDRNHSTVMFGVKEIENECHIYEDKRQQIEDLNKLLNK